MTDRYDPLDLEDCLVVFVIVSLLYLAIGSF